MHIKSIILDGFKSYANRTVVSGFDENFNAITGLNGSGKSNILDSICFVLGISQLSQVRVNNLQEIVYKQGQARVKKASVTLIFDNSDPNGSPAGYEHYKEITVTRQVIIGGRNRYMINGHSAQLNRVTSLFHSIHLNINNPHFLIMQGRITKVLGMKPVEILGMIEEAAGTRMYETKKLAALKTISRKQQKLNEIERILHEEIRPQLKKLREERSHYHYWTQNNQEITRLTRFHAALRYSRSADVVARGEDDRKRLEGDLKETQEQSEALESELAELAEKIETMIREESGEMKGEADNLEQTVDEVKKEVTKRKAVYKNRVSSNKDETKGFKQLVKSIEELEASINDKETEAKESSGRYEEMEGEHKALQDEVQRLQAQQLGFSVSSSDQSDKGSLAKQLMDGQKSVKELESALATLQMRSKRIKQSIDKNSRELNKSNADKNRYDKEIGRHEENLNKLRAELQKIGADPDAKKHLEEVLFQLEDKVSNTRHEVEQLRSALSRVTFDWSRPYKNFDDRKVKGLVARLVHVKDNKFSTALEVAAGGRLYQVVVDTQETGKALLKNGRLKRRVTILPLNKIASRTISDAKIRNAENLVGRENVSLALNLVGYDQELAPAMEYVFGTTLVCPDMNVAKQVTFDPSVRARTVTLDGDSFDPSGTLTGGSRRAGESVLSRLALLREAEQRWENETKQAEQCKHDHSLVSRRVAESETLISKIELAEHEMEALRQRMGDSKFAQLQKLIDEQSDELKEISGEVDEKRETLGKTKESVSEMKRSLQDFEKERKRKEKQIEKDIKDGKKKITTLEKELKKLQQNKETNEVQMGRMQDELKELAEQRDETESKIAAHLAEEKEAQLAVDEAEKNLKENSAKLKELRARLVECNKRISKQKKKQTELTRLLDEKSLEIKKLELQLTKFDRTLSEAQHKLKALEEQHEWIESEKHMFGMPNTDYDFGAKTANEVAKRLEELEKIQRDLNSKINKKAQAMVEKAEQDSQNLESKRKIVINDKRKIEKTIEELDRKKFETLEKTWKKVNTDFGSIFTTLLPGAQAKLVPVDPDMILKGVEVNVGFNDVWKESLTELSGGQRSLLALSLILALLMFKPAPFYILDEIDSALDLSHTQNIGRMLKHHFAKSQFIVVSLKEGMFNNANVVYRTRFVDGVSTVSRTARMQAR